MKSVNIYLGDIDNAKEFCSIVNTFEAHMDLDSGHNVVDAKSLLGVLSICIAKKCTLHIVTPLSESEYERLDSLISRWKIWGEGSMDKRKKKEKCHGDCRTCNQCVKVHFDCKACPCRRHCEL